MAISRPKDLRKMNEKDLDKRLKELNMELAKERANIKIGASVISPGKIKEMKRTIARIKTVKKEMEGKKKNE